MIAETVTVYLPDTRGVTISRFGKGNNKVGSGVFTYSRLPHATCPGRTTACEAMCYADRVVAESGAVAAVWARNSATEAVPEALPDGCRLLRLHVSGDFTSVAYIDGWTALLSRYPDVTVWAYTRSWRVPKLLPALERLRALPKVQLFASMDASTDELPPADWRRAWMQGDVRLVGARSLVCPEQTGAQPDCEACGYCFTDYARDVTFIEHDGTPLPQHRRRGTMVSA